MKILAVTINTGIDKTYRLAALNLGAIQKPAAILATAGGKGVNVARVLRTLGVPVRHFGVSGGHNGRFIEESLAAEGIPGDWIRVEPESRLCLIFLEDINRRETVVNEYGKALATGEIARIRAGFRRAVTGQEAVVLSGSLQRGVPDRFYADLIGIARTAGARVFLDASGEPLRLALAARPYFAAPNCHELKEALGMKDRSERTLKRALRSLAEGGVEIPVVKCGARGALALAGGVFYRAVPPKIEALSPIGCGDAFVAGFLFAYAQGFQVAVALRHATAVATANALEPGAGFVKPVVIRRLFRKSRVKTL